MFNEYLEVITGDGQKITLSSHFSENSKKSILINHGMAEHQRRYKEFINFLNLNGINVFIYDHRGHGNRITASDMATAIDLNPYESVEAFICKKCDPDFPFLDNEFVFTAPQL